MCRFRLECTSKAAAGTIKLLRRTKLGYLCAPIAFEINLVFWFG
jgi:hypothetical protein